jgi:hypothetical protein
MKGNLIIRNGEFNRERRKKLSERKNPKRKRRRKS